MGSGRGLVGGEGVKGFNGFGSEVCRYGFPSSVGGFEEVRRSCSVLLWRSVRRPSWEGQLPAMWPLLMKVLQRGQRPEGEREKRRVLWIPHMNSSLWRYCSCVRVVWCVWKWRRPPWVFVFERRDPCLVVRCSGVMELRDERVRDVWRRLR